MVPLDVCRDAFEQYAEVHRGACLLFWRRQRDPVPIDAGDAGRLMGRRLPSIIAVNRGRDLQLPEWPSNRRLPAHDR